MSEPIRDAIAGSILPLEFVLLRRSRTCLYPWQDVLQSRAQAFSDANNVTNCDDTLEPALSKGLVHTTPPVTRKQRHLQQQMVQEIVHKARWRCKVGSVATLSLESAILDADTKSWAFVMCPLILASTGRESRGQTFCGHQRATCSQLSASISNFPESLSTAYHVR